MHVNRSTFEAIYNIERSLGPYFLWYDGIPFDSLSRMSPRKHANTFTNFKRLF